MTEPTADQDIERYLLLRDHIDAQSKAFAEWAKPLRAEMEAVAARVHTRLLALGGDKPKLATGSGTAFLTTTKNPRALDRDEYLRWCLKNWDSYGNAMLQVGAPKVEAINEYMDAHEGHLPPHVELKPNTSVTIRKT